MAASASSSGGPSGWSSGVNNSVGGPESSSGSAAAPALEQPDVGGLGLGPRLVVAVVLEIGRGSGLVGVEPGVRISRQVALVEIEVAGVGGVGEVGGVEPRRSVVDARRHDVVIAVGARVGPGVELEVDLGGLGGIGLDRRERAGRSVGVGRSTCGTGVSSSSGVGANRRPSGSSSAARTDSMASRSRSRSSSRWVVSAVTSVSRSAFAALSAATWSFSMRARSSATASAFLCALDSRRSRSCSASASRLTALARGVGHRLGGGLVGLLDRLVGGPLGQHEDLGHLLVGRRRARHHAAATDAGQLGLGFLLGPPGIGQLGLGRLGPLGGRPQVLGQLGDGVVDALEVVVDLFGVVPALPQLRELHIGQELGCSFHDLGW